MRWFVWLFRRWRVRDAWLVLDWIPLPLRLVWCIDELWRWLEFLAPLLDEFPSSSECLDSSLGIKFSWLLVEFYSFASFCCDNWPPLFEVTTILCLEVVSLPRAPRFDYWLRSRLFPYESDCGLFESLYLFSLSFSYTFSLCSLIIFYVTFEMVCLLN